MEARLEELLERMVAVGKWPQISASEAHEVVESVYEVHKHLREHPVPIDENHPNFEAFIRAFWRRIEPYKNNYGKELPEKMPIEFRCSMETAILLLRGDESDQGHLTISFREMAEHDLNITPPSEDEATYTCKCGLTCNIKIGQEYCSLCNRAIDLKKL